MPSSMSMMGVRSVASNDALVSSTQPYGMRPYFICKNFHDSKHNVPTQCLPTWIYRQGHGSLGHEIKKKEEKKKKRKGKGEI